ncbi:MAG TPA: DUF3482 domain-containing protein [Casimicrobiaceae bacterium]|nr:DUF3482 domain-containing protein [Casimicrobiaceae bacterium]
MSGETPHPPRDRSAPSPQGGEGRGEGQTIALSLIAHTNVGKTTLARTLLDRDVGEVRDEPHVTGSAERYTMIETAQGDVLELWDTPGFGDSARLARRLASMDRPIAGLLAMTWDRFRDRALWSSQQAVANVREEADVVLYLVNASESPGDAGYVEPELRILEWIGKPVIALLNQTGPPRTGEIEAADIARWQNALREHACIKGVLSLDAFARCWVQEGVLLREVAHVLPQEKLPAFARLAAAWQAERNARFTQSMSAIAAPIAQAACDRVTLPDEGFRGAAVDLGRLIGVTRSRPSRARTRAVRELSRHLDDAIRGSTDRLIEIHHLGGRAADEVLARLADDVTTDAPWSERKAAMVGGFVSGALTGLAADLAVGGLTFGAGLLAGGIVGAMGGAGIARGVNLVRGRKESVARWSDELLVSLMPGAVLRYLMVAHYGRGRGDFAASEHPAFWRDAVNAAVERQGGIADIVALRGARPCDSQAIQRALADKLEAIALDVLATLYPAADVSALRIESRSADNGRPA